MKPLVAAFLTIVVILAIAGYEGRWRADHNDAGPDVVSPDGRYVARFFLLPEASEVPYGQGVYVRPRHVPLWSVATRVVGAYCAPGHGLRWAGPTKLVVRCTPAEGTPRQSPPPRAVDVVLVSGD